MFAKQTAALAFWAVEDKLEQIVENTEEEEENLTKTL
jgi:hypothetical protein